MPQKLCGETEMPFPKQYLDITSRKFHDAGFEILEQNGCIEGRIHRFLLVARKGKLEAAKIDRP